MNNQFYVLDYIFYRNIQATIVSENKIINGEPIISLSLWWVESAVLYFSLSILGLIVGYFAEKKRDSFGWSATNEGYSSKRRLALSYGNKKAVSLYIAELRGRNIMVALGYIVPTIIAIFFVGFFAPLVGIIVGFFIHIITLLLRISKKLDKLMDRLEESGNWSSWNNSLKVTSAILA
jgi:hypothetical protein